MAVPRRTLVLFAIAGIGLVLFLSFFSLYTGVKTEKKLRIQKEAELSQKMMEMGELQKQITSLTEEKEANAADLESKSKELETIQKKIRELEDKWSSQTQEFEEAKNLNSSLSGELAASKTSIDNLTKKIKGLEMEKADLQETIKHYEEERAAQAKPADEENTPDADRALNEEEIIQSFDTVKLGKIVVQKDSGKAVRVQLVNTLYGFIIVNAGKRDGLVANSVINVVRNNKIIGKAVIEKLKDNTAAAVTMPEWNKDEIRVGDMISRF